MLKDGIIGIAKVVRKKIEELSRWYFFAQYLALIKLYSVINKQNRIF